MRGFTQFWWLFLEDESAFKEREGSWGRRDIRCYHVQVSMFVVFIKILPLLQYGGYKIESLHLTFTSPCTVLSLCVSVLFARMSFSALHCINVAVITLPVTVKSSWKLTNHLTLVHLAHHCDCVAPWKLAISKLYVHTNQWLSPTVYKQDFVTWRQGTYERGIPETTTMILSWHLSTRGED